MIHHAELPSRVLKSQSFLIHMTLTGPELDSPSARFVRQTKSEQPTLQLVGTVIHQSQIISVITPSQPAENLYEALTFPEQS